MFRLGRVAVVTLVTAMIVAGCASSGPTGNEILTGSISPQAARLVIYRNSAFGFAVQPDYLVDGRKVGISQPNGFIVCDVRPGRHEVAIGNLPNVNLFGGSERTTVDLRPGTTTFLHAQPQPGLVMGMVTLSQVAEQQGRSDTSGLHKIESTCV